MKIKEGYSLHYDVDDITILQSMADGTTREICSVSETAAMAWEGIERGMDRQSLIDAIVTEFDGVDRTVVERDLQALLAQLRSLGFLEE